MGMFGTKSCAMLSALALSIVSTGAATVVEAQTEKPATSSPVPQAAQRAVPPAIAQSTAAQREAWRQTMLHTPKPKKACYRAVYPGTTWQEIPCVTPPKHYFEPQHGLGSRHGFGPKHGPVRDVVGNGDDYVAQPANPITLADGSFDSVTGATTLSTSGAGAGGVNGNNDWTLQLNSDFFNTKVCPAAATSCQGFAQFVYDNNASDAYIQYWLVNLGTSSCPTGWTSFAGDCVQNASGGVPAPMALTVADLSDMKITGSGASGGSITLYVGGFMQSSPGDNIIPDLANNWGDAEYNVFGDGGGGQAVFNAGTTIVVRTQVDTGVNILPDCIISGWTAETNNLDLSATPTAVPKAQYPSILFDESNASGAGAASCSTSVGDTHITTFDGLYYNFQAAGDFVLSNAGSDFIVQARQESGAKVFNNPNVTMNTAVAMQMGSNRIAIYDSPARVVINGKTTAVTDNGMVTLSDGVYVMRVGSTYVVTRDTGELVNAKLYNGWMDISVGLGHRPRSSAHGILASSSLTALTMADGTVLKQPVSTSDLYQRYGPSWAVQPSNSLFAEQTVKYATPAETFNASSLDPQVYAKAHAACVAAGITDPTHLDACTLDSGVFNDTAAVKAFTHAITPHITITPVETEVKQP